MKAFVIILVLLVAQMSVLAVEYGSAQPWEREDLETRIIDEILPAWVGTPWSYSGVAEEPGNEPIACGHFVTRVLEAAGFDVDHSRLGQQTALNIMRTVSDQDPVWDSYSSPEDVVADVLRRPERVFLLGLKFHTGFLVEEGGELYFAHASYLAPREVVIERAIDSEAFRAHKPHVYVPLFSEATIGKLESGAHFATVAD